MQTGLEWSNKVQKNPEVLKCFRSVQWSSPEGCKDPKMARHTKGPEVYLSTEVQKDPEGPKTVQKGMKDTEGFRMV